MGQIFPGNAFGLSLPHERSYGFVVVHRDATADRFLLVRQLTGNWSFPKGHIEEGEQPIETARRELKEETGITDIEIVEDWNASEEYIFMNGEIPTHKKNVFFLGFVTSTAVVPQEKEIAECRFVTYDEALALFIYENPKKVLRSVQEKLAALVRE